MRPTPISAGGASAAGPPRRPHNVVLPFRRRDQPLRRSRRPPLLRLARLLVAAVALVALPLAALAWPLLSPRFALRKTVVESGDRVPAQWVERTLEPLLGQNLPLLSLSHVERLLKRHPWVEAVALRKALPDRLRVEVREKRAEALLRDDRRLIYLDRGGRPIAAYDPRDGAVDLPLVSRDGERGSLAAALALAHEIAEVDPPWAAGLSEIEVLGEDDFRIHATGLPFPLLVRGGTLAEKLRRLDEVLPHVAGRYGRPRAVDLRFARRILVQTSVERRRSRKATADAQSG